MDTPPPATVEDEDLLTALDVAWGVDVDRVRYHPKGVGSYHWLAEAGGRTTYFVTVDDLDTKPWIATRRDSAFDGLGAAYEAAWLLRHEGGLASVVGPLRRPDGSVILRLSEQYSMAVFPFVAGDPGRWGETVGEEVRSALLGELARLHRSAPLVGGRLPHRPVDLPQRQALTAALDAIDRPWQGGPFAEPARHALADAADDVTAWLGQLDLLAGGLEVAGRDPVLTHGEPHPGNLIRTAHGLCLIDWDTAALAGPERDLWMLDDGAPDTLAPYEELTGTKTSRAAIDFYRLTWTLSDIASFAAMFRSPHRRTGWVAQKWGAFQRLLGGAPSAPFGRG